MIKEKIINLLMSTERKGMDGLVNYMVENGFFTAPCSSKFHLCREGGLAEHSWNVYQYFNILNDALDIDKAYIPEDSIIICTLLHDLGKIGAYNKPYYVPNVLKSGKVSEAEPYKTNKDLLYEEHEIRSVVLASTFIPLTEEEEFAILNHNGLYGKLNRRLPTMQKYLMEHWTN